jgi:hypothetical protein
LGFNYLETYSPVVRFDTLCTVLALILAKNLKVQQMDVKGTYLNSLLEEMVYMKQPEGYEDGTGQVCKLIKTTYDLKQAG